jgi:hypothetical protein
VSVANDRLLRDFAIRAVEAQPLGYAESALKGLALVVEWPRHKYPDASTVPYYYFRLQPQVIPAGHSWIPGGTAYQDAVRYGRASPSTVVEPFAAVIALYERIVHTYGPLLGLIPLSGLGGVVRVEGLRQRRPRLAWSRRAGSMMPWVNRYGAAGVPDRGRRLRLPVPAPRPAVRRPGCGPRLRAGPCPARAAAARAPARRRAAG